MQERTPEIITCAMCGVEFARIPRGRRPKCCTYCTTNRRRLEYEAQTHTCGTCGVIVERRVVNGPFPEFCQDCGAARRSARNKGRYVPRPPRPPKVRVCLDCPEAVSGNALRCAECRRLRNLATIRAKYVKQCDGATRNCCDCHQAFTWCTDHWTRRCEPCHEQFRKDLQRSRNLTRRARLAGVECERINSFAVFAAAAWICALCGEPVDPVLKFPHPGSPTLDHIVPISRGGGHVRDNVQLAHMGCNSRKGNRVATNDLGAQHG